MRFLLSIVLVLACSTAGSAQVWDPRGLQLSRPELEALLARYDSTARSPAYSDALRDRARAEAELIRQRLEEGDIRVGDRVVLIVEGYPALSDTFAVGASRGIVLPDVGEVPLTGVLRAELQPHLAAFLTKYLRDPVVHAQALVRLEITGAVARPGYYTIPTDILLTDALMLAGGPLATAGLDKVRIRRGAQEIWEADRLREATIEGRTLDQLSIRAGDSILVPQGKSTLDHVRDWLAIFAGMSGAILVAQLLGIL